MCDFGRDVSDFLCSYFVVFRKICLRRCTELKPNKIRGTYLVMCVVPILKLLKIGKPPPVLMYLNHFCLGIGGEIFLLGDVEVQIGVMYAHLFL